MSRKIRATLFVSIFSVVGPGRRRWSVPLQEKKKKNHPTSRKNWVTFAPSFSVVGLAHADITAGPSPFYFSTSVTWIDLMDLSAGSCPPTPMGPRTRAGSKQKSIRSGTASPSMGAAPH
jgi:hypothetical protein